MSDEAKLIWTRRRLHYLLGLRAGPVGKILQVASFLPGLESSKGMVEFDSPIELAELRL